jgi:hypothetical protein
MIVIMTMKNVAFVVKHVKYNIMKINLDKVERLVLIPNNIDDKVIRAVPISISLSDQGTLEIVYKNK